MDRLLLDPGISEAALKLKARRLRIMVVLLGLVIVGMLLSAMKYLDLMTPD